MPLGLIPRNASAVEKQWICDMCERTPNSYTGKEEDWVYLRYHCDQCNISCCQDCMPNWMKGKGDILLPGGVHYRGEFNCGDKQGKGSIWYPNGQIYEGEFHSDTYNGYGHFIFGKNIRYVIIWCDMIWYAMIYDMIWYDMMWCDVVW